MMQVYDESVFSRGHAIQDVQVSNALPSPEDVG